MLIAFSLFFVSIPMSFIFSASNLENDKEKNLNIEKGLVQN